MIKRKSSFILSCLFILCLLSCGQTKMDEADMVVMELPHWSLSTLEKESFKNRYAFDTRINPFYLNVDVNGDKNLDLAAVIVEKASGRRGMIVLEQATDSLHVFGAGTQNSLGGANWNWLIGWKAEDRLTAGSGVEKNVGTAFILFTDKNTANWLYWDGQEWEWITQ